ncbi:MAG: ATP-dependent helicase, partial [Desulfovibrio sp.]|nr:ATP-dependent helicase [Desulfovibrio sp.]
MIDYAQALNEAQLAAVTAGDGPVLVVAGAGSGKTRTIVYRLAWLAEHGVDPGSILLLTFTRKAAREMLQRAGALLGRGLSGVTGGTFHAFAYSVLRRWRPAWLGERPFTLMDQADITAAVRQCKARLELGKGDRSFPKSASIVAFLSKARNKELPLAEVLRREAFHLEPYVEQLERLGEAYTAYRRENGLLDYDDLLFELEALLRDNAEAAASLRARFRHILVDEYQDTNLVQARIVRLLAGPEGDAGEGDGAGAPPCNVMAVGDEAQSIYAFRGANVRNILDFPKLFPGARILPLEENYRSTRPVLDVANSLLEHAAESFDKHLFTRKEGGEPVRLVTPLSDETQAALVARRIGELLESYAPHEIAVLFRAGRHSFALEAALKRAGIAFRKYGGLRFAESAHNKDVVAFARLALNPLDLPSFSRIAAMHKGVGPKTVER